MTDKKPKHLEINAHDNIGISDISCDIRVTTVAQGLLSQAESFLSGKDPEYYKICVVLAHSALEVEVSRVDFAYLKRNTKFSDSKIDSLLRYKTNIAGKSNREARLFFELVTNHKFPDNIDFAKLNKMNDKRNAIIHKGEGATKEEAEDAINYSRNAIKALQGILKDLRKK